MEARAKAHRGISLLLLGLLAVVFGFLIVLFPGLSSTVIIELIGIFIITLSFGVVLMSAVAPGGYRGSILLIILGVIGFFFGIATVISPYTMADIIFILAGIALFIGGLLGIAFALPEKHMPHKGMFALQGVLTIILGVILIIAPMVGIALLVILLAAYFIVWGLIAVIAGAMILMQPAA
ncbi:MAG TPA: DUF308 domain-containing protein [Methanomicrobiales archaeon]|jgi:uncharacterized membrane protein HdeD (DUF308 family)|nr:DUF308 domain-containing protein [Methanomicrobiales archaeon]